MNLLGNLLRESRIASNLTVHDLIQKLDRKISKSYITKIEIHGEIPSPFLLIKLCEVLNLNKKEMLDIAKNATLDKYRRKLDQIYK